MKKKGVNHALVGDYVWIYSDPEIILRITHKYFYCYNSTADKIVRYYKKRCKVVYSNCDRNKKISIC